MEKNNTKSSKKEFGYNLDVLMSTKIRIDNAIGMFSTDAAGKNLRVKPSGNGAVIPFLKRYTGKKVIVFVVKDI